MTPAGGGAPPSEHTAGIVPSLYLLRHAKAKNRERWDAPDGERPLTTRGFEQAGVIAGHLLDLVGRTPSAALSSPAVRCLQTIQPLAAASKICVVETEWLNEGSNGDDAFEQLHGLTLRHDPPSGAGGPVAACSHGDVIWTILDRLGRLGVDLGPSPDAPKGGVWIIGVTETGVAHARLYVPDPERGHRGNSPVLT
jgi:broad specificity phosphatase PhoE